MTTEYTIVIGGGAIGLSVAYHLGKLGVADVLLLERNQLTSGTSWHAAGIVGPLRASKNLTELARYGIELFRDIEIETGQATGYRQTGGLWLASEPDRMIELKRIASMGRMHQLDTEMLDCVAIKERMPLLQTDDLAGAMWVEQDGQINPVDLCMAYARGARQAGVEIREHCGVIAIHRNGHRVTEVELHNGEVLSARSVINCAGLWSRQIGKMAGVEVPLRAVEHIYIVTETIANRPDPCPIIRDLDHGIYIKGDAGKLVLGTFESNPKLWDPSTSDPAASYLSFDADWEHAEPMLKAGINRLPMFGETGISQFMNGPESFTPDTRQVMGRAPGLENFYVAAGFNSIGIMSSAGVGRVMADWVHYHHPPMDMWEVDIARFTTEDHDENFLDQRIPEAVHNQFQLHWPYRQYRTGRNRKQSAWHQLLKDNGAVFGAPTGWERPLWYARSMSEQSFDYSYNQQCWWPMAQREAETLACSGAVFELSPFSKFIVRGEAAATSLGHLCSNKISGETGNVIYSLMLNQRAGIEMECTVTRLATNKFMVVSGAATRTRDYCWISDHLAGDCEVIDVTDDYGVLGVMGPRSAELMSALTGDDFSIAGFRYGRSKTITLDGCALQVNRVSYVGESGFELFIPNNDAMRIARLISDRMKTCSMIFAGHFCLDGCRLEKGYVHWGHDIGPDDNPRDAGLMFAIDKTPDASFTGDSALREICEKPPNTKRVLLEVIRTDEEWPLLLHDEPVLRNGVVAGRTTSGGIGFRTRKALAMAWLSGEGGANTERLEVEIAGKLWPARQLDKAPYDWRGTKMRSDPC